MVRLSKELVRRVQAIESKMPTPMTVVLTPTQRQNIEATIGLAVWDNLSRGLLQVAVLDGERASLWEDLRSRPGALPPFSADDGRHLLIIITRGDRRDSPATDHLAEAEGSPATALHPAEARSVTTNDGRLPT